MPRDPHGISYLKMKIRWAKRHLDSFYNEVNLFQNSEHYNITHRDDAEQALHIVRFELRPMREELALHLGDFAYALRSGLDQLTWQLALMTNPIPYDKTEFPIHDTDTTKGTKRINRLTQDVPWEAVQEIKALQPYHRGTAFKDHPLWQLGRLCNIDKHCIFAVNSIDAPIWTSEHNVGQRDFDQGLELLFPLSVKDKLEVKPRLATPILGEPIQSPTSSFGIQPESIAEIYRFVREDVLPRFSGLFERFPGAV